MSEPIKFAKGSYGAKVNPAWAWPPGSGDAEEVPPAEGGLVLSESWPIENQNDDQECAMRGSYAAVAQSFTAKAGKLHSVKFYLKRNAGTDPVQIAGQLWAMTGTIGQDSDPVGAPLATSAPLDSELIPEAPEGALFEFLFDDTFALVAGTNYCIGAENLAGALTMGRISFGSTFGLARGVGHPGNYAERSPVPAIWNPNATADLTFYLYTV
jgi:hypothetical protein